MKKLTDNLQKNLKTSFGELKYFSLPELESQGHNIKRLPFSIRILLENVLRNYDDFSVTKDHLDTVLNWDLQRKDKDIAFKPAGF